MWVREKEKNYLLRRFSSSSSFLCRFVKISSVRSYQKIRENHKNNIETYNEAIHQSLVYTIYPVGYLEAYSLRDESSPPISPPPLSHSLTLSLSLSPSPSSYTKFTFLLTSQSTRSPDGDTFTGSTLHEGIMISIEVLLPLPFSL